MNKTEKEKQEKALLGEYIPHIAVDKMYQIIKSNKVHLHISKTRSTKLGDYKAPMRKKGHRISVNHNLNKYSFLITLVHEIAHMEVYKNHKRNVKPHGTEWQNTYRNLMNSVLQIHAFPEEINYVVQNHIIRPSASSGTDLSLQKALKKYDKNSNTLTLEDIENDEIFMLENGESFRRERKMRTRYKCIHIKTKRVFSVHPLTPVKLVE